MKSAESTLRSDHFQAGLHDRQVRQKAALLMISAFAEVFSMSSVEICCHRW